MAEGWTISRTTHEKNWVFPQQLHSYDETSLRLLFTYYKDDLTNVFQTLDTEFFLRELQSRNVLNIEDYLHMREDWKMDTFCKHLLEDVMRSGRDTVIRFWECLFELQNTYPKILAIVDEITNTGEYLVEKILSDEHGRKLAQELRENLKTFRKQLYSYDEKSLRLLFKYYRKDLTKVFQNLDTEFFLRELQSRNVLNTEDYLHMRDEWKTDTFSKRLLEDLMKSGFITMTEFWEYLFELQNTHPKILTIVFEIARTGERLVEKILRDEYGHMRLRDNTRKFCLQLYGFEKRLRLLFQYYRDDLIYILQTLDTEFLLRALQSRNVLNLQDYLHLRADWKTNTFCNCLLEDVIKSGILTMIGFWECLLERQNAHPNILAIVNEITNTGEHLGKKILFDEHGRKLTPELRDIQKKHKQHLLEETKTLVEPRLLGSTLEPQRFPINERYVNLTVSIDPPKEHTQNELIKTALKHGGFSMDTNTDLEHTDLNDLFCWSYQSRCVPHAVMVSGVPGIGKTTLMKKIVYDWANGELYQRFAFVFLFTFRELNNLNDSLEEMILQKYPHLENQIGNILQHPERLLFIFDGLDESIHQIDFKRFDLEESENVGVIVDSLVRQKLLMGSSVLITSRPSRLASINTFVFQRMTEIIGFLPQDQLIYFDHFFGNKELSEKAFHYVQENDTLYTFCYIPSYCWIVCTVLSMFFRDQPAITEQLMTLLPKTLTQLFVTFVSNILASHKKDYTATILDLLTSIGWMAEHGVMNHMTVFDRRHLDSFKVRTNNGLFSCLMIESGRHADVDYTFLQLTLQEFFAALVHFINYNPKKLQESLDRAELYKDGRAEIFLRFLCGLLDSSTRSMLESHVGGMSADASRHVISWIQWKANDKTPDESIRGSRDLLNVFYYLHESRNKELVLQCIGSNRDIDFAGCELISVDCSVLSFILESCRETESLNLKGCKIQDEGLRKLVSALHIIRKSSLYDNHLTDSSCPHLASGVRDNHTLRRLDLSKNNLEGPHFRDLMTALTTSRLEELLLNEDNLTDSSCPDLASGIRNNRTLRTLDLSHNNLEGPHFSDLMTALSTSRIEELLLNDNKLGEPSCAYLAREIGKISTLSKLDLSSNNLRGPYFSNLMKVMATTRLDELILNDNGLTDSSCAHLTSGIENHQTLRRLDLSGNNLEGPHFSDLMTALTTSRIEDLLLNDNNLTDNSCPHLASGIRNNWTLRRLDLSGNNLEGPHFSDLMTALTTSRIEELLLQRVMLTDKYTSFLVSLAESTSLTLLDLSDNELTDASATYIQDLIVSSTSLKEIRIGKTFISLEVKMFLQQFKPKIQVYIQTQFKSDYPNNEEEMIESEEEPSNLATPIINGNMYRLELKPGQLSRCSETGIMFQVKSPVTITYELESESDYRKQFEENGYDVVGPVFNITVQPDVVSEVHLPHYMYLEGKRNNEEASGSISHPESREAGLENDTSLIKCGNFKDGKIKITRPLKIGPSYVVLKNPSFSKLYILFSRILGKVIPLKGKVLLFGRVVCPKDVTHMEYKFHLHLMPENQPQVQKLNELKKKYEFHEMGKPPTVNTKLYIGTHFAAIVQPNASIIPEDHEFDISHEVEGIPYFEVNVDSSVENISLHILLKPNGDSLWTCVVTKGDLGELRCKAGVSLHNTGSSPSTRHFVDCNEKKLIQGVTNVEEVLDDLKEQELLTNEQYDKVLSMNTSQDQMRELFKYVRGWGDDDKDKLLNVLQKTSQPQIKRIRRQ